MKIIHIITSLEKGGAERSLYNLVTHNETIGEHYIISLKSNGYYGNLLKQKGFNIYSLNFKSFIDVLFKIFSLKKIIDKFNPDIIQGWMYHGNFIALIITTLSFGRKKCFWNIRMGLELENTLTFRTKIINMICAFFSFIPQKIVFNSSKALKDHNKFGYFKKNCFLIENGFDSNFWKPKLTTRKKIRNHLKISEKTHLIGFVGRYCFEKNLELLIDSFLKIENEIPNAKLICIGDNLKEKFIYIKSKNIIFLNFKSNIEEYICSLDILCLTSIVEGFPNVIGEAMLSCVPCIASEVGDIKKIIDNTGWTFKSKDQKRLCELLVSTYNFKKIDLKYKGKMARQRIIKNYDLKKTIFEYNKIYSKI